MLIMLLFECELLVLMFGIVMWIFFGGVVFVSGMQVLSRLVSIGVVNRLSREDVSVFMGWFFGMGREGFLLGVGVWLVMYSGVLKINNKNLFFYNYKQYDRLYGFFCVICSQSMENIF